MPFAANTRTRKPEGRNKPVVDISYINDNSKFNYRVCALFISGGRVLAMRDERSPYYYLPGGRVRLGETAERAILREIR